MPAAIPLAAGAAELATSAAAGAARIAASVVPKVAAAGARMASSAGKAVVNGAKSVARAVVKPAGSAKTPLREAVAKPGSSLEKTRALIHKPDETPVAARELTAPPASRMERLNTVANVGGGVGGIAPLFQKPSPSAAEPAASALTGAPDLERPGKTAWWERSSQTMPGAYAPAVAPSERGVVSPGATPAIPGSSRPPIAPRSPYIAVPAPPSILRAPGDG